jgi:hypothetical protein
MIHERCSCGASIKTDEAEAVKLVKEWRKNHRCEIQDEQDGATSGTAQVENVIGFQVSGLSVPAREYDPFEDKSRRRL